MIVYIAYYENEHGIAMASSFGWTENLHLAKLYIRTHRLSGDESCKPKLVELNADKDDWDEIYSEVRDMNFYPYTPSQNHDTEIRVMYIEDIDSIWGNDLAVITTYDTVYSVLGTNMGFSIEPYSDERSVYGKIMDNSCDALRVLHWLLTGNIVKNEQITKLLNDAVVRVAGTNFLSYKEFNNIKYCIETGYLIPV